MQSEECGVCTLRCRRHTPALQGSGTLLQPPTTPGPLSSLSYHKANLCTKRTYNTTYTHTRSLATHLTSAGIHVRMCSNSNPGSLGRLVGCKHVRMCRLGIPGSLSGNHFPRLFRPVHVTDRRLCNCISDQRNSKELEQELEGLLQEYLKRSCRQQNIQTRSLLPLLGGGGGGGICSKDSKSSLLTRRALTLSGANTSPC